MSMSLNNSRKRFRGMRDEPNAIWAEAVFDEQVFKPAIASINAAREQNELRPRHRLQDLCPCDQGLFSNFHRPIQTTKCHLARSQHRKGADRRDFARVVGECRWESDESLHMLLFANPNRIGVNIGESVVHGRKAGRAGKCKMYLHGRGAMGEDRQPGFAHVAAEVYQHIDAVFTDNGGGFAITRPADVAPTAGQRLQLPGRVITVLVLE